MMIEYGFGKTQFGSTFIALENGKLVRLSFVPRNKIRQELALLRKQCPHTELAAKSTAWAQHQLEALLGQAKPRLALKGTPFQLKVWKALMAIPRGTTTTYSEIAHKIGHPTAVRAVGSAVGANPIGYLVPCHRVLPKAGGIGQFGWGPELKEKMLQFEEAL